jgi:hypothetical protein
MLSVMCLFIIRLNVVMLSIVAPCIQVIKTFVSGAPSTQNLGYLYVFYIISLIGSDISIKSLKRKT